MVRRLTTLSVDAELLEALERAADDEGLAPNEVAEEALRRYFGLRGLAILSDLADRQPTTAGAMTDDQAMALAIAEIPMRSADPERAR